jgi:hypothetical protein
MTGQPSTTPGPAVAALDALADRLTDTGYDGASGRYTYVHFREWASATSVMAVFDERVWVGDDGSGRDVRQRYPDQPLGGPPRTAGGGPVRTDAEDFPAAGFPRSLPEPLSADPSVLAGQLDSVNSDGSIDTEDCNSVGTGTYATHHYPAGSAYWPSGFIHVRDLSSGGSGGGVQGMTFLGTDHLSSYSFRLYPNQYCCPSTPGTY